MEIALTFCQAHWVGSRELDTLSHIVSIQLADFNCFSGKQNWRKKGKNQSDVCSPSGSLETDKKCLMSECSAACQYVFPVY